MRWDARTQAYVARRTTEGLAKKDIIRCLKRHVSREVYRALMRTFPHGGPHPWRSPADLAHASARLINNRPPW
jgi:hypothetical protein